MIRGFLTSSSICASVNRPPTCSRPSTSMNGSKPLMGLFMQSLFPVSKLLYSWAYVSCCTALIINYSAHKSSSTVGALEQ